MKNYILVACFIFGVLNTQTVLAVDEFGERFTNSTPPGLAEGTYENKPIPAIAMDEQAAEQMQKIMPAAGSDKKDEPGNLKSDHDQNSQEP